MSFRSYECDRSDPDPQETISGLELTIERLCSELNQTRQERDDLLKACTTVLICLDAGPEHRPNQNLIDYTVDILKDAVEKFMAHEKTL